jgi:hypothetical protein
VKVSADLQIARVYYTTLGDEKARRETARALERATPFFRRHLGSQLRLRRVPRSNSDSTNRIGHQDRIEQILATSTTKRPKAQAPAERMPADPPPPPRTAPRRASSADDRRAGDDGAVPAPHHE